MAAEWCQEPAVLAQASARTTGLKLWSNSVRAADVTQASVSMPQMWISVMWFSVMWFSVMWFSVMWFSRSRSMVSVRARV